MQCENNCTSLLILCFLANVSMLLLGSEPMDWKQIMGTLIVDSSHIFSMSRITPSAYFAPIDSAMYLRACGRTLSGQNDRISSSFLRVSREIP